MNGLPFNSDEDAWNNQLWSTKWLHFADHSQTQSEQGSGRKCRTQHLKTVNFKLELTGEFFIKKITPQRFFRMAGIWCCHRKLTAIPRTVIKTMGVKSMFFHTDTINWKNNQII